MPDLEMMSEPSSRAIEAPAGFKESLRNRQFSGLRLRTRLILFFMAVAVLPLLLLGALSYRQARQALIELGLTIVQRGTQLQARDVTELMERFAADLLTLSALPPVQGIIRADVPDGIDPLTNTSYEAWAGRLTETFVADVKNQKDYQQLRYLDEFGNEIVRVDYHNDQVIVLSGTDKLQNKSSSEYFVETKKLQPGEIYISPLNLNRENGQIEVPYVPVIRFSTPIFDAKGAFKGIIISNVYADAIFDLLVSDQANTYLVNEAGYYLLNPDPDKTFGFEFGTDYSVDNDFHEAHTALHDHVRSSAQLDSDRGEVIALQPIHFDLMHPDRHWLLITTVAESQVLGQVASLRSLTLGVALVSIVVVTGLAIWIARSLTGPIEHVTQVAQELAQGNIVQLIETPRRDEVGLMLAAFRQMITAYEMLSSVFRRVAEGDLTVEARPTSEHDVLGTAVEQMVTNLRLLVGEVIQNSTNVEQTSEQLSIASGQAGQATGQIAMAIQQVAAGIIDQSEALTMISAMTDAMTLTIQNVANSGQHQAAIVSQSAAVSERMTKAIAEVTHNAEAGAKDAVEAAGVAQVGNQTIEQTIKGIEKIKAKVDLSVQKVQEMNVRSQQIGAILETIDEIARQTNLLALNAAIEAARAGEHGRGFAIVADEVRKLAEKSAGATQEIAHLVQDIQRTVTEAISTMHEGAAEAERGVAQAGESEQALQNILRAVARVRGQVETIALAAKDMNSSAGQLSQMLSDVSAVADENRKSGNNLVAGFMEMQAAMENIAGISQENSAATQQISAATEEMTAQVDEVASFAYKLSEMTQSLQKLVVRFKLEQSPTPAEAQLVGPNRLPATTDWEGAVAPAANGKYLHRTPVVTHPEQQAP